MAEPAAAPGPAPGPGPGPGPVPVAGVPYPQLQRTPGMPAWRPLLCLLYGTGLAAVLLFGFGVWGSAITEVTTGDVEALDGGPAGFLFGNVLIAAGIGAALAAVATVFLRPPGGVHSVAGRLRRGWLLRSTVICTVWALLVSGLYLALDGPPGTGGEHAALVIVIGLLTTPFQAAGEEYLLRGWATQAIGAWFARPVVGAVVAALATATVFAFLHGQQDLWLWADRFVFGLIASWLVWWTGGLEAAIALHALANLTAIVPTALEGTLDEALTASTAPVLSVVVDIVTLLVAAAVLGWAARRFRVPRLTGGPAGGAAAVTAPSPAVAGPAPSAPPAA